MFENVKSLTMKGRGYREETTLNIFENRFNVLYGCNGSGKSTIARAMRQIAGEEGMEDFEVARLTGVDLEEKDCKKIYVFDQCFIDENVGVEQDNTDGLNAIVLLGKQGALKGEIDQLEESKRVLEARYNILKREEKGILGELDKFEKMLKDRLRTGWIVRHGEISGDNGRHNITQGLLNRILDKEAKWDFDQKQYDAWKVEYDQLLGVYRNSLSGVGIAIRSLPRLGRLPLDGLQRLLQKRIENPELSERDHHFIDIFKGLGSSRLELMRRDFVENDVEVCPYCFQEIGREHKEDLCRLISLVLNREVEDYKREVESMMYDFRQKVKMDWSMLREYDGYDDLINECEVGIANLNGQLDRVEDIVNNRIENLYQDYNEDICALGIDDMVDGVNKCIGRIESKIYEFNRAIHVREDNRKRLDELNDWLAVCEFKSLMLSYNRVLARSSDNAHELNDCEYELFSCEQQLNAKKGEQADSKIAVDEINESLADVYGDEHRMKLNINGDGYYEVWVNNSRVKPMSVSTGERNIIGLCYFFTLIYQNERANRRYYAERLLVIDDPISSFDMNNKLGVMSMMRRQFNKIIYFNPNSKILVMSHDMQTVQDLMGFCEELRLSRDEKLALNSMKVLTLSNYQVDWVEWKGHYQQMIEAIYRYAEPDYIAAEYEHMTMGNVMRKVLEAYATFNFNSNMKWLFRDHKIQKMLGDRERKYYENRMYRLFLNGDSHEVDVIKNGSYIGYTPKEKQQTARDILMLMNLLTPMHIRTYLGEDKQEEIKNWHDYLFVEERERDTYAEREVNVHQNIRGEQVDEKVKLH